MSLTEDKEFAITLKASEWCRVWQALIAKATNGPQEPYKELSGVVLYSLHQHLTGEQVQELMRNTK